MLASRIASLKGSARCTSEATRSRSKTLQCSRGLRRWQSTSATSLQLPPSHDDRTAESRSRQNHRRRRFPKYLKESPNATLALRVKSRSSSLTWQHWNRFRSAAGASSLRLPVVTLQALIRRDEERMQTSLSECFNDKKEWKTRLNSLAYKGVTQEDIRHWAWILDAEDGDARIARFVSTSAPKPIFLLFQLLRKDETLRQGSSLVSILDYVSRHHIRARTSDVDERLPFGAIRRSLDPRLNMTPQHFVILLRRLVDHCLRAWPSFITSIARLATSYIEGLPAEGSKRRSGYAQRCLIFNSALQLFQRPPPVNPVAQMKYNWRAQKIMLTMSVGSQRPLVIDRASYRAMRKVMLGLRKSAAEGKVASRLAKTWPPYRQEWDGMDERRRPVDDLSRSVKAGVLMHEIGYADEESDRALGVLGGAILHESPTIQTRSLPPHQWSGALASLNIFSTWAARIKATRNAHEAWNMFQMPPQMGMKPNFQVYGEMFAKLYATGVTQAPPLLPGDSKEALPFHDQNLSDFERARLTPPSAKELYAQMLRDGTRPVGTCLVVLVENARSVAKALHYFHDSGLSKVVISALEVPHPMAQRRPSLEFVRRMPLPEFNAYISLLCRLQSRYHPGSGRQLHLHWVDSVHHAIRLCGVRLSPVTREGKTYKAPWHTILDTLAQRHVVVTATEAHSKQANALESLALFMKVFTPVRDVMGMDARLFDSLCQVLEKAIEMDAHDDAESLYADKRNEGGNAAMAKQQVDWMQKAHGALTRSFRQLTEPPPILRDGTETAKVLTHPKFVHSLHAAHLKKYVRVMARLDDASEVVHAMDWILQSWDDDSVLEDAKDPNHRQHAIIMETISYFRMLDRLPPEVATGFQRKLRQLQEEKGCTWMWPSQQDALWYAH